MTRWRTLLGALLGLAFLLQGMAVSAAPTTTADTPCQDYSCCDAACPNMATCALGHMAAPPVMPPALPAAARAEHAFTPVRVISRTLASLLRPPITLHG